MDLQYYKKKKKKIFLSNPWAEIVHVVTEPGNTLGPSWCIVTCKHRQHEITNSSEVKESVSRWIISSPNRAPHKISVSKTLQAFVCEKKNETRTLAMFKASFFFFFRLASCESYFTQTTVGWFSLYLLFQFDFYSVSLVFHFIHFICFWEEVNNVSLAKFCRLRH